MKKIVFCLLLMIPAFSVQSASAMRLTDFNSYESAYMVKVATDDETHIKKSREFVDSLGQKAIDFISDESLSEVQKERKFRVLLESKFDLKTIARFALGRYFREADKEQRKEYYELFREMVVNVYSSRFNEYSGEKLVVSEALKDGPRDVLVKSHITPKSGPKVTVEWRIRHKNGEYKVVDVIVEGVSMSVTQRSEFASIIDRGGGNIDALITHLKTK